MPELRLHYRTIGEPSGEPVLILHGTTGSGASMLTPAFAGELFGPGQPLDARQVFHHPAGRDRRREIVQALRRPARQISALQLRRHGRRAVPAGDRGPGHPPPAPRARQFDGRHADLDLGRDIPGLHGCAGADGVAADRDVEPQLDDAAHDHRHDPQRSGLERRQLHDPAARAEGRQRVLRHRHQRRHAGLPEAGARRASRPTSCSTSASRRRSRPTPTTSSISGIRRATTIRRPASSASRPRCSRSIPPTTSAIRRKPASWSASSSA